MRADRPKVVEVLAAVLRSVGGDVVEAPWECLGGVLGRISLQTLLRGFPSLVGRLGVAKETPGWDATLGSSSGGFPQRFIARFLGRMLGRQEHRPVGEARQVRRRMRGEAGEARCEGFWGRLVGDFEMPLGGFSEMFGVF